MLVFIEGKQADARAVADAARALKHRVVELPEGAPSLPMEGGGFEWGFVFGDAFAAERYEALHHAAKARNVALLNDAAQFSRAIAKPAAGDVALRQVGDGQQRRYRLFVLDADVVAMGFVGADTDCFGALSDREQRELTELGREAAVQTRVPWLAVDAAQLESGGWHLLSTQDPAGAGLSGVDATQLLASLARALDMRGGC